MSAKTIVADVSCCRDNHNRIHIEVKCDKSNVRFLDILLTAEQFGKLITGAYMSELPVKVEHLDLVGKKKVREDRSVVWPSNRIGSREEQEQFIIDNCQEEGWKVYPALRSQNSVSHKNGETILNYAVYKYVSE